MAAPSGGRPGGGFGPPRGRDFPGCRELAGKNAISGARGGLIRPRRGATRGAATAFGWRWRGPAAWSGRDAIEGAASGLGHIGARGVGWGAAVPAARPCPCGGNCLQPRAAGGVWRGGRQDPPPEWAAAWSAPPAAAETAAVAAVEAAPSIVAAPQFGGRPGPPDDGGRTHCRGRPRGARAPSATRGPPPAGSPACGLAGAGRGRGAFNSGPSAGPRPPAPRGR